MSFIIIMRGYAEHGLDKLISGYFRLFTVRIFTEQLIIILKKFHSINSLIKVNIVFLYRTTEAGVAFMVNDS